MLIVFGVMKWLDVYTRHGEAVVVPDVKGMTVDEASKMFRNHGLVCVVSDSNYVKNMAAGIVLDVNPGIGQKVKEGRTIYLTINTLSIPLRAVPDVADNSSLRQAQAKVLAAGFKLTEIQLMNGEKDWVYGIKYQGRSLNAGDKVVSRCHLRIGNVNCAGWIKIYLLASIAIAFTDQGMIYLFTFSAISGEATR